jgi:predicted XRE-type DNA-binding protein
MPIGIKEGANMGFPSEKELILIRAKLAKAEPSRLLPKNASKADRVKYKLCEKFVIYLTEHKISQVQLAKKLKVDPSRINEIVKYRIDLYTVDKLMDLAERLELDFEVEVA